MGLPAVKKYAISLDRCLEINDPHLQFNVSSGGVVTPTVVEGLVSAPSPYNYGGGECKDLNMEGLLNVSDEQVVVEPPTRMGQTWSKLFQFIFFLTSLMFAWRGVFTPEQALLPGVPGNGLPLVETFGSPATFSPDGLSVDAHGEIRDGFTPLFFPEHYDDPPMQFVQTCSFRSDRALRAVATVVGHAAEERKVEVSVDSGSDVNYALRELLTDVHPIQEEPVDGIGGSVVAKEEGTLRVVASTGEERCIPALVADSDILPRNCKALIGEAGIEDLNVDTTAQREKQRQPLQCNLSEKRLRAWWEANAGQSIETKPFDVNAVDVNPELPVDFQQQIRNIILKYVTVFEGSKGSLPKPFRTDPVELNFIPGCSPSAVPEPKWSFGFGKVVEQWAIDGIKNGLLEPSQSEWASRPHIVLKPPSGRASL